MHRNATPADDHRHARQRASRRLAVVLGITHATLQIEPPDFNVVGTLTVVGSKAAE